ncbi:unnamed protein product [Gadus morhua 'NCC']
MRIVYLWVETDNRTGLLNLWEEEKKRGGLGAFSCSAGESCLSGQQEHNTPHRDCIFTNALPLRSPLN